MRIVGLILNSNKFLFELPDVLTLPHFEFLSLCLDIFDPQYTNKTVMRIGGLILNSTKLFPLFESADVLALPNSSH